MSPSLRGEIRCSSCSVLGNGSLLVEVLKTSVTLITLSINDGRNTALKQVCSNYNRFIISSASEQLLTCSMLVLYCLIPLKKLENWITDLKSAEQFEITKLYSNRLDVKMHFCLTPLKLHDIPFLDITSTKMYPMLNQLSFEKKG